jgi:hypothetical protein
MSLSLPNDRAPVTKNQKIKPLLFTAAVSVAAVVTGSAEVVGLIAFAGLVIHGAVAKSNSRLANAARDAAVDAPETFATLGRWAQEGENKLEPNVVASKSRRMSNQFVAWARKLPFESALKHRWATDIQMAWRKKKTSERVEARVKTRTSLNGSSIDDDVEWELVNRSMRLAKAARAKAFAREAAQGETKTEPNVVESAPQGETKTEPNVVELTPFVILLVKLGFSETDAAMALDQSDGNFERAVDLLLQWRRWHDDLEL